MIVRTEVDIRKSLQYFNISTLDDTNCVMHAYFVNNVCLCKSKQICYQYKPNISLAH